jgi:dTDP-4-amino-4,6-dideoxygalactose transaminase
MQDLPGVPFNRPALVGRELDYIRDAFAQLHVSGDGSFTRRCEAYLACQLRAARVLLTTSCTHALDLAALVLDISPGDEVIVPSFTFTSTANAFVLRGARPVFADIRPDTMNIDEERLGCLISPRTRAIAVVHYAGVGCEMDPITALARERNVALVEDNAHGLFGTYRDRPLGSFGEIATLSFHETKNFTCGEGGALVINRESDIERAEILREKGTNRSRFFRGMVDKYTWVDVGSSYAPSDILAAVLFAQFEAASQIQSARERIWRRYDDALSAWASDNGVQVPTVPDHCRQAYHLFYLVLPSLRARDAFIEHLKQRDVMAVFHYQPLHLSAMGQRLGGKQGQCPVAERMGDCLVRLPFYLALEGQAQDRVLEAILSFQP